MKCYDSVIYAANEKEKELKKFLLDNFALQIDRQVNIIANYEDINEEYDFAVETEGDVLVFRCPVFSFAKTAINTYMTSGEFGRSETYVADKIYYSDFGAVGDGVHEDFEAMKATHEVANTTKRYTVCADEGTSYYIQKTGASTIEIATDVYWGNATIIIDDRFITDTDETKEERLCRVFSVIPEHQVTYDLDHDPLGIIARINAQGGISADASAIPLDLGYDALVVPVNSEKRMYMRWDPSGKSGKGQPQQEVIVVRADNTIDESTKPLFPYAKVDQITISRCDTPAITLKGGKFITIATREDLHWNLVERGFLINRSNVIIDGMDHYVENQPLGEPIKKKLSNYERLITVSSGGGPNYNPFIYPIYSHNTLIINSKFCGRVHYNNGSYDLGGHLANKTVFRNCTQYNMFRPDGTVYSENTEYWGIHGSNYCKNIEFYDCELSRLDAHAGVYNVIISGCKIGKINVVGGGKLLIENTTVYIPTILYLRQDYASSWIGDITIRNVHVNTKGLPDDTMVVIGGDIHNSDYGFDTHMAKTITIDNVTYNKDTAIEKIYVMRFSMDASFDDENVPKLNHVVPADILVIRNQQKGYEFTGIEVNGHKKLYKDVVYE